MQQKNSTFFHSIQSVFVWHCVQSWSGSSAGADGNTLAKDNGGK